MGRVMRLVRIPGVYGPCRDSELIAAAVGDHVGPGDRVLDVFTGSGFLAIHAARAGAREVHAIDVARRAIAGAWLNSRLNGVRVRPRRGDMFAPVAGELFDVILANPPYVPSVGLDGAARGAARAWEGGPDGRRLLDPLLEHAPRHLRPGGRLLVVHSSLNDELRTLAAMQRAGLDAEIVASETAPLGPITAPRAESLRERGLLGPGEGVEATVVIRGVAREPLVEEPSNEPVAALGTA